ncbi:MAG TPA: hypothetical protein VFR81_07035, partial [Longimicrobium sp.]|nr:hypothetical protein [Longimicrobium sp.]
MNRPGWMDRRRLLMLAPLLLAPLLVWGALRLTSPGGTPVGEAHELPRAPGPAIVAPDQGLPWPPEVPADVRELLRQGRNWRAARRLRELVRADSDPDLVLAAARAEAGWGGWGQARALLDGKPWLDTAGGGVGWYLLGRARGEAGEWQGAADAYARYLRASPSGSAEASRPVAELRHALALLRAGRTDAGVQALERMRGAVPEASGWAGVLAAEAIAPRGDTARVRSLVEAGGRTAEPAPRAYRARVAAYDAARDPRGARAVALAYARAATTPEGRAEMIVAAAKAALRMGDTASARRELPAALRDTATAAAVDAAWLITSLGRAEPATQLAVAAVYERHGNRARAASAYRAWLASPAGTPQERADVRLRLGRALFAAGEYADAEAALRPLLDGGGPAAGAEASHLTGRAMYRRGVRAPAIAQMVSTANRFRGQPFAGEALYMAADLTDDTGAEAA